MGIIIVSDANHEIHYYKSTDNVDVVKSNHCAISVHFRKHDQGDGYWEDMRFEFEPELKQIMIACYGEDAIFNADDDNGIPDFVLSQPI